MSGSVGTCLIDEIERVSAKRQRWQDYATIAGPQGNFGPAIMMMTAAIDAAKEALSGDDPRACIAAYQALKGSVMQISIKNTGKPSEAQFEDRWQRLGKAAYVHRFVDAAEVRGRTGAIGTTRKAPADYLVTHGGSTHFAEVKSTTNPTSFAFSLIKVAQSAAAVQAIAAAGDYRVYVHNLLTGRWYVIPWKVIAEVKASGRESIKWTMMEEWSWT